MGVGSVLNNMVGYPWEAADYRRVLVMIDQVTTKYSRPPVIWGLDSIHGANYVHGATLTPQPISMAATFNRTVAFRAGMLASRDTRAAGINWLFAPLLGIAIQPQWSRVYETFGEDPYLVGQMASAMIDGIQHQPDANNHDNGIPSRAAACAKHFVGYSMPHNGHDRSPSWIPKRHLYQYFVPPWREALKRSMTVMESYTEYAGVPNVANPEALDRLLRQELGFDGLVVTDYAEIFNLKDWHLIVSSTEEAVAHSMLEGSIDMSMIPKEFKIFQEAMLGALAKNAMLMERVDRSVERVLRLKEDLGMMDRPPMSLLDPNLDKVGTDRQEALEMTRESIVLVKNENNVLPIPTSSSVKVLVTGPTADSLAFQSGGWTWQWQGVDDKDDKGWFSYGSTVLEAARNVSTWDVSYNCGVYIDGLDCSVPSPPKKDVFSQVKSWVGLEDGETNSIEQSRNMAGQVDYVIVCVGEENYAEKPGDISSLELTIGQLGLVNSIAGQGAKIILVYFGGRPRLLDAVVDDVDAVLIGFLPGPDAGKAVIDIISNQTNPSGRLPITYPKYQDAGGSPYFHSVSDQCTFGEGALPHNKYGQCEVQWPFGHGLSYTEFEYSDLKISANNLRYSATGQQKRTGEGGEETLKVSVKVKNVGTTAGSEAVLFFTFDESRVVTPEYKRLRDFEKIHLEPGQQQTVSITISANDPNFQFIGPHDDTHLIVQNGMKFRVGVGLVDCRVRPREKEMCSAPIEVLAGSDYIAACDAACRAWEASACGKEIGFSSETCWAKCVREGGPANTTHEGW